MKPTTTLARLVALLDQKIPGARKRPAKKSTRRYPWLGSEHAALLASLGPGTILGIHYCRVLTIAECIATRAVFTNVDPRGD